MNCKKKNPSCVNCLKRVCEKNTMLCCKKTWKHAHFILFWKKKKSNVKKIKSIILTAWSLSSLLPSLWMRVSLRPSPSGTWVPSLDSWFWFWKHKLQLIMYRNCKCVGDRLQKKLSEYYIWFWTIIEEVSPRLWGVLGGCVEEKSHKKWCVGRKKEITVALMRTRASGAISSEL